MQELSFYADAAGSQPSLWPQARAALLDALATGPLNASSVHQEGQRAKRLLRQARYQIAELLGAHPDEVVFTSGATEGLSTAIYGLSLQLAARPIVAVFPGSHRCVTAAVEVLSQRWPDITTRPTAGPDVGLAVAPVVLHHTGDFFAWHEHVAAGADYPLVLDASQAGLHLFDLWRDSRVSALAFSGHKLGAPGGIGVLLLRQGIPFVPTLHGGSQEQELRAGTEPVALACALAAALQQVKLQRAELSASLAARTAAFEERLLQMRGAAIVSKGPRTAGITAARITGVPARALVERLDRCLVFASSGAACAAQRLEPDALSLGLSRERAVEVFRVSFPLHGSLADAHAVAETVIREATAMRAGAGQTPQVQVMG